MADTRLICLGHSVVTLAKITNDTSPHTPDNPMYVDETTRFCPHCEQDKRLAAFAKAEQGEAYSILCVQCVTKTEVDNALVKKADAQSMLANALSKATGRKLMSEMAPSSAKGARDVLETCGDGHGGGESGAWKLVGETLKEAMESDDTKMDTKVKAASVVINLVTTAEKNQGEPINTDDLTLDEQIDILWEPARQMVLQSAEFRQQLLNNPDIRKALLLEAGVELVEA